MNCCRHCQGLESLFDDKTAAKELKQYRRQGPGKTTRMLIDALKAGDVAGLTLLDIGGGVGAIQHELLRHGARSATAVDASSAYLKTTQREAERLGHDDQVEYHHGNFVELASSISPADIVTLDRVICCYPDMPALVELSSARAKKWYGLVFPRDTWWMKTGMALINFSMWLTRNPYRFFIHSTGVVERILRKNGFRRQKYRKTFLWQIAVYER